MGRRKPLAIAVFMTISFSIHARGVGEMSAIEECYFDSSGLYMIFATAERFDDVRRIAMNSKIAMGNDIGNAVFYVTFEEFEILDSTFFIPIEVLRRHAVQASGSPSYHPLLSKQQYNLSFSFPGGFHIVEVFVESPIRDSTVNLLEVPIADKVNIRIISQSKIHPI